MENLTDINESDDQEKAKINPGWDNLKPFKKGDDPERWAKRENVGRPKGKSVKKILREILAAKISMEDPETSEIIEVDKKTAIAIRLVVDAYADDDPNIRQRAAKMIFDHTDPVKTKIDHTSKGESLNTPFANMPLSKRMAILEILESENDTAKDGD